VGLLPHDADNRALLFLLVLAVGTVLAATAVRKRQWAVPGAVLATAGVVGWTLTSSAYDGPVLAVVVGDNGVHAGDLLSVPAAILVLWLSVREARA
jgi:hypothetical protein